MNDRERQAAHYMIIGTFGFSMMHFCIKWLGGLPVTQIVCVRALFGLLVSYSLIRRTGEWPVGKNKRLLILRGLTGTCALILYYLTLQQLPLANAVTIVNLYPFFTLMFSSLLLKERVRPMQMLFFFVAFVGVAFVKGFDGRVTYAYLGVGLLSAVFAGMSYTLVRALSRTDRTLVIVFYFSVVSLILLGPYSLLHWVAPTWEEWALLGLVCFFTQIGSVSVTKALQLDRASNLMQYNYLQVLIAAVFGYWVFSEYLTLLGAIGILMIVGGMALVGRFRSS